MHNKKSDYIPYLFGGLIGAFIGLLAVYLIENSTEVEEGKTPFSRKKLTRLGLSTISMLSRLINPGKGS